MKSGRCPKCNGNNIFVNSDKYVRGYHSVIDLGVVRTIMSDTYICGDCGYTEDYLDQKNLKRLKSRWRKV